MFFFIISVMVQFACSSFLWFDRNFIGYTFMRKLKENCTESKKFCCLYWHSNIQNRIHLLDTVYSPWFFLHKYMQIIFNLPSERLIERKIVSWNICNRQSITHTRMLDITIFSWDTIIQVSWALTNWLNSLHTSCYMIFMQSSRIRCNGNGKLQHWVISLIVTL